MLWLFQHTCTPPGTMDARWSLFSIISQTFGLGQTNWVDILGGSWSIFGQTIKTILVLWVPRPWENGFSCFIFKKLWFSGLKHMCLKYIPNMIFAVNNLGNSHHTSIVGAQRNMWLSFQRNWKNVPPLFNVHISRFREFRFEFPTNDLILHGHKLRRAHNWYLHNWNWHKWAWESEP